MTSVSSFSAVLTIAPNQYSYNLSFFVSSGKISQMMISMRMNFCEASVSIFVRAAFEIPMDPLQGYLTKIPETIARALFQQGLRLYRRSLICGRFFCKCCHTAAGYGYYRRRTGAIVDTVDKNWSEQALPDNGYTG